MIELLKRLETKLADCIDDMDTDENPSAGWDPGSEIYIGFTELLDQVEKRIEKLEKSQ